MWEYGECALRRLRRLARMGVGMEWLGLFGGEEKGFEVGCYDGVALGSE